MAEKYGTIPKRFTKEWWSWYWMYHKGITLGAIFAIILITIAVVDCVTKEHYDITLTYSAALPFTDDEAEKLEDILSPMCEDLDDNGEKAMLFSQNIIDFSSSDAEYLKASLLKTDMAMGEEKTYLFILSKDVADRYLGESEADCSLAPLEDWAATDISGFKTYDAHEKAYGVDISTLDIFKESGVFDKYEKNGLPYPELYLFMRSYPTGSRLEEHKDGYEASARFANKILEYKSK